MGRKPQPKPRKLAYKLSQIRMLLGISQQEMISRLKALAPGAVILPGHISQFESGARLPSLLVLLAYAQLAGISTDVLIDDRVEMPECLIGNRW